MKTGFLSRNDRYYIGGGLGDAYPLDYVFAGAELIYQATFSGWNPPPTWKQAADGLRLAATSNFDVRHDEENEGAGSIFYDFVVRNDFRSINDVKALMDGAAYSVGFPIRASMIRFVSNPRRDDVSQPSVGTPGVNPSFTTVPSSAGGVDTTEAPGLFNLSSAGDWWGKALTDTLDSIGAPLGIGGGTIALLVVGFFVYRALK